MKIISRHKDSQGKTIGYTIDNNGNKKYFNADFVIANYDKITNAYILSNGEFRANSGESIETVVDTRNLLIHRNITSPVNHVDGKAIGTIDFYGKEYINTCKRIRRYAIEGKLTIQTDRHKSNNGANIHLMKLIEASGIGLHDFVTSYLSVIQPYSLDDFQGNKLKDNIWLVDIGYKIRLVIKINEQDKNSPMIVSFHESNKGGKFMPGKKDFSDKPCAVIVDKVTQLPNGYNVEYLIQRGFIRYKVSSATAHYNNGVALVKYRDIKNLYDSVIELVFEQIQTNYYSNTLKNVPIFVQKINTDKISFLSNGFATVNNIFLMIDLFNQYTDYNSRAVVLQMVDSIIDEMPQLRKDELRIALKDSFDRDKGNKLLNVINSLL